MTDTIFYFVDNLSFNDYLTQLKAGEISEKTVVFADSQRQIYKGGQKYGTMTKAEIESTLGNISEYLKEVPAATASKIGGILTGFEKNDVTKQYPVQLDMNNKAFVQVPWERGAAVPGEQGKTGNYTQQAFKSTTSLEEPNTPNSDFPYGDDGWKPFAENADATKHVWMTTRLVDYLDNPVENWKTPWLISGPTGQSGVDGEGIEFVYVVTSTEVLGDIYINSLNADVNNDSVFQRSGYIPKNWKDHPEGVSENMRYEWMASRTKDSTGKWSSFRGPVLWSHWGRNGMDGDGVEYIYYKGVTLPTDFANSPTRWYSDSSTKKAYQEDEYKGPSGSRWEDDPYDLTQQGEKQWVSVRKYKEGEWKEFSTPALWSYYAKDGVSDGYTIDLSNANMPVGAKSGETITNYQNTCSVQVFHNGSAFTNFTVTPGSITRSDGKANTGIKATSSGNIVTISLTNVSNFAGVSAYIPIRVTISGGATRDLIITVYGVDAGEAGAAIDLWTSASVIRTSYDKYTVVPSRLKVGVKTTKGSSPSQLKYVTDAAPFTFRYYYDDNSTRTPLTSDELTLEKGHNSITIEMLYQGEVVDSDEILYIQDGAPGIGLNYNINVTESTFKYKNEATTFSGSIIFNVTRIVDNAVKIMPDSTWSVSSGGDGEYLKVKAGGVSIPVNTEQGIVVTKPSSSSDNFKIEVPSIQYKGSAFVSIVLYSATGAVLASQIVPFIMEGKDGVTRTEVQGLNGTVMRIISWSDSMANTRKFYTGDEADKGVLYIDIVECEGSYYRKKGGSGTVQHGPVYTTGGSKYENYGDSTGEWSMFTPASDAAFNNMIAKSAYIKNLTAAEVVITEDGNPVAGITSGKSVSDSNDITRSDVRIWAGTPKNGNLYNCPFYVTNKGAFYATDAHVTGQIDAISGTFKNGTFTNAKINNGTLDSVTITNATVSGILESPTIKSKDGLILQSDDKYLKEVISNWNRWARISHKHVKRDSESFYVQTEASEDSYKSSMLLANYSEEDGYRYISISPNLIQIMDSPTHAHVYLGYIIHNQGKLGTYFEIMGETCRITLRAPSTKKADEKILEIVGYRYDNSTASDSLSFTYNDLYELKRLLNK